LFAGSHIRLEEILRIHLHSGLGRATGHECCNRCGADGARSETKPVWRISLFTNVNLLLVVCASYGFQIWSHHSAILGRFLRTSQIPHTEGLLLAALGTIPLLVLELVKFVRNAQRQRMEKL
jgi:hypothetical protein